MFVKAKKAPVHIAVALLNDILVGLEVIDFS
jgi:hypothetical protein